MVLSLILLAVGGCKRSSQKVIAGIPLIASQDIYLEERAGLEEQAASLGIAVDWNGPSDPDPQRQVDLLTEAARANRYGIVLNPVGTNVANSAIRNALSRNIPVVIARDPVNLPPGNHLSFILQDHTAAAALVCSRLNSIVRGEGKIAIVGIVPESDESTSRLDALEKTLRRDCPRITVADRAIAPYSSGYVQIMAQRTLERHPDLTALVALNERAGLGAQAAVKVKKRVGKVRVITFDPSLPLLLRLRRGEIDSIVVQNMRSIGKEALLNIDADRRGLPYNHRKVVEPMLVTRDNVDLDSTQEALLLNWVPQ